MHPDRFSMFPGSKKFDLGRHAQSAQSLVASKTRAGGDIVFQACIVDFGVRKLAQTIWDEGLGVGFHLTLTLGSAMFWGYAPEFDFEQSFVLNHLPRFSTACSGYIHDLHAAQMNTFRKQNLHDYMKRLQTYSCIIPSHAVVPLLSFARVYFLLSFQRGLSPPGPPSLLIWGIYNLEKRYYMDRMVPYFLE